MLPFTPPRKTLIATDGRDAQASARAPDDTWKERSTRGLVRLGIEEGFRYHEIADAIGVSRPTVAYHARRLGYPANARFGRRYDWNAIRDYYEAGHSLNECRDRFGFQYHAWRDAVRRGVIKPRPHTLAIESLLVDGRPTQRTYLKLRLLDASLKTDRCESCGISEWRGAARSLALHHVNGRKHDNRLENLQLLCPNCHSQTDNFGGRNRPNGADGEAAADSAGDP